MLIFKSFFYTVVLIIVLFGALFLFGAFFHLACKIAILSVKLAFALLLWPFGYPISETIAELKRVFKVDTGDNSDYYFAGDGGEIDCDGGFSGGDGGGCDGG